MSGKFTKGEWCLSIDCGDKTLIHCGDNVICEGILCSFNKVETEPHRIEAQANAYLIATAPEMYNLIKDLRHVISMGGIGGSINNIEVLKSIDSVLCKARGDL